MLDNEDARRRLVGDQLRSYFPKAIKATELAANKNSTQRTQMDISSEEESSMRCKRQQRPNEKVWFQFNYTSFWRSSDLQKWNVHKQPPLRITCTPSWAMVWWWSPCCDWKSRESKEMTAGHGTIRRPDGPRSASTGCFAQGWPALRKTLARADTSTFYPSSYLCRVPVDAIDGRWYYYDLDDAVERLIIHDQRSLQPHLPSALNKSVLTATNFTFIDHESHTVHWSSASVSQWDTNCFLVSGWTSEFTYQSAGDASHRFYPDVQIWATPKLG